MLATEWKHVHAVRAAAAVGEDAEAEQEVVLPGQKVGEIRS